MCNHGLLLVQSLPPSLFSSYAKLNCRQKQLRFSSEYYSSMATVRTPWSTTATTLLGKVPTKTFLSSKPFHRFFFPRPITSTATVHHLPPLMNTKHHPLGRRIQAPKAAFTRDGAFQNHQLRSILLGGAGLGIALLLAASSGGGGGDNASAAELPSLVSSLQLNEPGNALSLPTWAIHVSSVVEWIAAMILVWQYGEKSGYESWKGLSWGMVPLLGGAFCACTWHFFYNSESLNILVALQAALTVIGNFTICIAAYRICKSSQEVSKDL